MSDLTDFVRLAAALSPWRQHLVFVGGWAHRLYWQHPMATIPTHMPLATRDADVAFAERARLDGSIHEALLKAGFKEELSGEHRPPVSRYTLGDEDLGFYAEFLAPLHGSRAKRNGASDATISKAGVTAQKLRHLEILLINPWQVSIPAEQKKDANESIELWIPNPVGFIVQKVLIRRDRLPAKRAQDVLYIHDTLELFAGQLPVLADIWTSQLTSALTNRQRQNISEGVQDLFSAVTDNIRDAARIPQDRSLMPDRMQAFCEQALYQVLG